jgi:hypothetical protein
VPLPKRLDRKRADDVLSTWIALEVLSPPQTYRKPADLADGDLRRVAALGKFPNLPWERGEKARPNTRLFYQMIVGAIRMEDITAKLLEIYSDQNIERVTAVGFAPIAILTLDSKGIPTEPTALAISSFAWGVPYALRRDLTTLGKWPIVEPKLIEEADRLARRKGDDEEILPVDRATIDRIFQHFVQKLALPPDCVVPPEFALRVYQWWKANEPPDPPPMGSFFLSDLAKAKGLVETGSVPELLERYLGLSVPSEHVDLRCDDIALAEAVAPSRIPAGSWPSPSGHPLVLLQQAAVNLAVGDDATTHLLPVNGPPGTGKTTLLRDLVVALIVQRARAMSSFADPNDAFVASGEKIKSGNAFTHHYQIDAKLSGFEIVVASSNNKAVENVSAELPTLKAIDDQRTDLRYFKSVADSVARGLLNGNEGDDEQGEHVAGSPEPSSRWGLIAAVLGNAKNRYAFRQTAWADGDNGLRAYFMEASGNPQTIEIKDRKTGRIIEKRKPRVVAAEKPPTTPDAALKRWRSARKKFLEAVKRIEDRLDILEKGRRALSPGDLFMKRRTLGEKLTELERRRTASRLSCIQCESDVDHAGSVQTQNGQALRAHDQRKPGLFGRIFGSSTQREWERQRSELLKSREEVVLRFGKATAALTEAHKSERAVGRELEMVQQAAAAVINATDSLTGDIDRAALVCGLRFADAAFFERAPEDLHRDTPWLDDETLRLRQDVFVAAMDLQRAFVDAAARQVRNNLDILFRTFFGRNAWTDRMRPLMPGLWTTFFCLVPVLSTTFASIERMLGYLDQKALGWLLVDEAGQAVPQAAVGALIRVRRAVVVGDPIQLPPVTSLPSELAEKIAAEFTVDKNRFVAPVASVQRLADASSLYGTTIVSDGENVRVGVPLVVHRRCTEPMFSLSNTLAYGGMMVQGRGEKPSSIRDVLGHSAWIDVKPDRCEDKWSAAEGRTVIELFRKLDRAGLDEVDIYLISPFRIVAQKLRELLIAENALSRWTKEPRNWVKEHVGTVYTVQGREADTVIMVLGAAEPQRRGARNWAGQDVNQLNVAVTRARENLYVIGNRFEWASAGKFEYLERQLT